MTHLGEVRYIKGLYAERILGYPNVIGVGVAHKVRSERQMADLCIAVLVRRKLPMEALSPTQVIPKSYDGVITDVIEVGEIRALQARTDRWRPVPGGVSIGHYMVTAGSLGCMVRDKTTGKRMILSNNHVLANSNQASLQDPILQPGTADGGRLENDVIARLARFETIQFTSAPPTCQLATSVARLANRAAQTVGSSHRLRAVKESAQAVNQVDAAVAFPLPEVEISDEILDIGVLGGTTPARLGMRVRKSGRTTAFTTGEINVLDATVMVNYGDQTARFEEQIVTNSMSRPGDSGSVLIAEDLLLAVGLLFAGSDSATIYNPISLVLEKMQVLI
jgi:hypothetical protein